MRDLEIPLAGEPVRLLPERALLWRETLVIADLHWGKAAAFRAAAIPVPHGSTETDLARLSALIDRVRTRRLLLLGDLLHARAGRASRTLGAVAEWRRRHRQVEIVLVRGNHDRRAGDPPPEFYMRVVDAPFLEAPFAFLHHPGPVAGAYSLAGHIHPAVDLRGAGRQKAKLPCFAFGPGIGILPAFGVFTGTAAIDRTPDTRIYAIAGDEVFEVPS